MLYSILYDEDMYFLNLHAECALHTYVNDFIGDEIKKESLQNQGIYSRKVNANILQNIYDYNFDTKDLCVDFAQIEEVTENNLVGFVSFIKRKICAQNKAVYFLNIKNEIFEKMSRGDEGFIVLEQHDKFVMGKIGNVKRAMSYEEIKCKYDNIYLQRLEKMIVDATDNCSEEYHNSVPVYLKKYINLKKMIEYNANFLKYAIYRLGNRMIEEGILSNNFYDNRKMNLFFHTMNGGYIATQISNLFNINMVYLDHLGPIKTVHRKHWERSIHDGKNYIIVSDVICLGGEVGRAKTIVEYCGGNVCCEVCIVDIKTISFKQIANRISLYTVSNQCNKIGYSIETDLCDACRKKVRNE